MKLLRLLSALGLLFVLPALGSVDALEEVAVSGNVQKSDNVSAIAIVNDRLVIGSDETAIVQILKKTHEGYAVERTFPISLFPVTNGTPKEIDIEGIAADANTVYVIGSHAHVRSSAKPDDKYKKNRERLDKNPSKPEREAEFAARSVVAKFTLDRNGVPSDLHHSSLRKILDEAYPFKLFRDIPSKENGIDIEGLAVRGGKLYAGFRGPVLRGNYVPILEFEFSDPVSRHRVLYVNLRGRGVRDIVAAKSGFLILAGPVGDGSETYQIYEWDGEDVVCGIDRPYAATGLKLLVDIPNVPKGAKAEGLAILEEINSEYRVLISFDGLENGWLKRFSVNRQDAVAGTCKYD